VEARFPLERRFSHQGINALVYVIHRLPQRTMEPSTLSTSVDFSLRDLLEGHLDLPEVSFQLIQEIVQVPKSLAKFILGTDPGKSVLELTFSYRSAYISEGNETPKD
jgi:hypothetical protein